MKKLPAVIVVSLSVALTSCTTAGPKQKSGALIGAVAGGLIGSQFGNGDGRVAATIIGAGVGALIGAGIGAELDARDRERLRVITAQTMRSGGSRSFRNAKTGVRARTQVIKTSTVDGKLCRTVQQDVTLPGGRVSRDTVSGCKGPNGWSV